VKIGVFDSGIGGLTVMKSLYNSKLFSEIIYFGDTARVPYGSKDKNTIIRYSLEAVEFFKNFNIELLVVACNSVSASAIPQMREEANFPVIGVVEAGVLALKNSLAKIDDNILVIGTKTTIFSNIYQKLLGDLGFRNIEALATGLFVPIVEEGIFEGKILDATMEYYFQNLERQPRYIILGCTHFPLIANSIANYFGRHGISPILIHSGDSIVEYLKNRYPNLQKVKTKTMFFASENPGHLRKIAESWIGI